MSKNLPDQNESTLILYQTDDGQTRIEVHLVDETVWLNQKMMADLFQKDAWTINEHIQNIYSEGELKSDSTVRKFRTVETEGHRQVKRAVKFYNLDVIISVGYRVSSHRGTQFRIWATQKLREYLIKGFMLDDARLKELGGGNYFEELLGRIRDIRSTEKIFWRKVLDIFSTSMDYNPQSEQAKIFFSAVQNKIHWAVHGHTAAELIHARANASKLNMGLTSWKGDSLRSPDVGVAKNYLNEQELTTLNRLVSMYLDFAELQALTRKTMYMNDWMSKLDDFLRVSEREILTHAGKISHQDALEKARNEHSRYKKQLAIMETPAEKHFFEAIKEVNQLKTINGRKNKKKAEAC